MHVKNLYPQFCMWKSRRSCNGGSLNPSLVLLGNLVEGYYLSVAVTNCKNECMLNPILAPPVLSCNFQRNYSTYVRNSWCLCYLASCYLILNFFDSVSYIYMAWEMNCIGLDETITTEVLYYQGLGLPESCMFFFFLFICHLFHFRAKEEYNSTCS